MVSSELLSVLLSLLTASDDVAEDSETDVVSPTLPEMCIRDRLLTARQIAVAAVGDAGYAEKLYIIIAEFLVGFGVER